ncbi:MAG: pyridoxine 5'-phosphate synthase [Ignavibacteria bacterium]|jgi:pyridoxine 5-phosphate synthase|nr:pyridoxine 5'-phosphate synthase [Ignavibacteria bacterium]
MKILNVNIDHYATIRNARGGKEPDPIAAAMIAELSGAGGIVCHLREDRRHIKDRDLELLREVVQTRLDLEMAATEEMTGIALKIQPELVTIVPEKREELTTEGGLDVVSNLYHLKSLSEKMREQDIEVSLFVDPNKKQIEAALNAGADMVEIHTGEYANAIGEKELEREFKKIKNACEFAAECGLKIAAGHGLNYVNTYKVSRIKEIGELSIGHSIVSRAAFVGLSNAVKEMLEIIYRNY